ncbi:MAG: Clp protease [Acidobacteria bacterium]|nr:MAG: Clp protease [Acidobacteriota bacterium]
MDKNGNTGIKTVFLDRDGVINRRIMDGYVTCKEELEILDGVPQALRILTDAKYRIVVVTNQRGIALGLYNASTLAHIHDYLNQVLRQYGVRLNEFYFCPHDRQENCLCRKPKAGLIDQANEVSTVHFKHSYLIGDSDTDLLAGRARHLRVIKIGPIETVIPEARFDNLLEAAKAIAADQIPE